MYTAHGTIDKSHLLESYLPTVKRIAVQMMSRLPASVELDDLIQAGRMGLIDAWSRYREDAPAAFETFATQRIRGAILDELRAMDWVPRSVRQAARKIEDAIRAASHRAGRAPTEAEIAHELKVSLAEYHELLVKVQGSQLVYAEDLAGEDSEGSVFDTATRDVPDDNPLTCLLAGEFRERLAAAIGELPEREGLVLSLHYEQELSLREIAAVLEISSTRVCQLHTQAIARLRNALGSMTQDNLFA